MSKRTAEQSNQSNKPEKYQKRELSLKTQVEMVARAFEQCDTILRELNRDLTNEQFKTATKAVRDQLNESGDTVDDVYEPYSQRVESEISDSE